MQMYQVVLHDGTKGHLNENQALRITKMIQDHPKYSEQMNHKQHEKKHQRQHFLMKNQQKHKHLMDYLKQEFELKKCPKTEEQLIELMYHKMPVWTEQQAMNFYKMLEVMMTRHIMEIFDQLD